MDEIGNNDLASIANCDRTIRVLAKGDAMGLGESEARGTTKYTNGETFS
jgi:hypothetical protein